MSTIWEKLKNFDPAANMHINGIELATLAFVVDLIYLTFHYIIKKLVDRKNYGQIWEKEKLLMTINPKEKLGAYTKLAREIAKLKSSAPPLYTPPPIVKMTRSSFLPLFFSRKWICEFPRAFWLPMARAVAFPHISQDPATVRLGFAFFWTALTKVDTILFKLITKMDL